MKYTNVYGDDQNLSEVTPSVQDSILSVDTDNAILEWVKGDSEQRIVIASYVPFIFFPLDGITYSGVLGKETEIIYRGKGSSVSISNLDFSRDLYFYVFGFNGVQSTEKYNRELSMLYFPAQDDVGDYWQWYSGIDVQWYSGVKVELE